jgi:hypothetical protein
LPDACFVSCALLTFDNSTFLRHLWFAGTRRAGKYVFNSSVLFVIYVFTINNYCLLDRMAKSRWDNDILSCDCWEQCRKRHCAIRLNLFLSFALGMCRVAAGQYRFGTERTASPKLADPALRRGNAHSLKMFYSLLFFSFVFILFFNLFFCLVCFSHLSFNLQNWQGWQFCHGAKTINIVKRQLPSQLCKWCP